MPFGLTQVKDDGDFSLLHTTDSCLVTDMYTVKLVRTYLKYLRFQVEGAGARAEKRQATYVSTCSQSPSVLGPFQGPLLLYLGIWVIGTQLPMCFSNE